MELHEAHHRLGLVYALLQTVQIGEAEKATMLLDEAAYLVTVMSRFYQDRYPVQVACLRKAQQEDTSETGV